MDVTDRIAAVLTGRPQPARVPKAPSSPPLTGTLSRSTLIPEGQRSTTELRAFFDVEIGRGFRFAGHMRSFLLAGGATLGDAVDHWHVTVGKPLPAQSQSLEFNRFTKAWHASNPDGTAAECREVWAPGVGWQGESMWPWSLGMSPIRTFVRMIGGEGNPSRRVWNSRPMVSL